MYPYQQQPSSYPPPPGGSNPSYPPSYPPQPASDTYPPPPPPGGSNPPYPSSPYQQSPGGGPPPPPPGSSPYSSGPGGFNPAYTHQPPAPYGAAPPTTGCNLPAYPPAPAEASPYSPPAPYGGSPYSQPQQPQQRDAYSPYAQAPPPPPQYGQPPAQPSPYGQPSEQPSPYGQPPAQPSPYGQPPAQSSPYGQPPAQSSPYGQPPAQSSPYGSSPYQQQQQQQQPGTYGGYGNQQQQVMRMVVNSASNMVNVEKFGKQDPYLQFSVNYQDAKTFEKTGTQKNAGQSCTWNQAFTLPAGAQEVYIEVMDAERAGFDEVIGFAAIPLNQVGPQGLNAVFPIYTVSNQPAGEVHLTFGHAGMQQQVTRGQAYVNEGHQKRVKGLRNKAVASDAAVGGAMALGVGLLAKHMYGGNNHQHGHQGYGHH